MTRSEFTAGQICTDILKNGEKSNIFLSRELRLSRRMLEWGRYDVLLYQIVTQSASVDEW